MLSLYSGVISRLDLLWKLWNSKNNQYYICEVSSYYHKKYINPFKVRPVTCYQCQVIFPKCCEHLYRSMCLHTMMDYLDKVSVFNDTNPGVCKAYHYCFLAQICPVLLKVHHTQGGWSTEFFVGLRRALSDEDKNPVLHDK